MMECGTLKINDAELDYLKLLAQRFPSIADASTEIINLEAIMNLPKGTEYFLTDLHGEHEAFSHVMRNASGVIRQKVNDLFGTTLRESEKRELCTLIYYPEQKLELVKQSEKELNDWYRITLNRLIDLCRMVSSKYTRSKVRKALPSDFAYVIEELLHEDRNMPNKQDYFNGILNAIIEIGRADEFIIALCNVIQRLTIDTLHIVGDIFDRGSGSHTIMDILCRYHQFDIQWGNHDILWMGAAAGNKACIANVIRIALRYANHTVLEDGYGINLLPLATFAMETYGDDPCSRFRAKNAKDSSYKDKTLHLIAQMHKAIAMIQFKLEGQIIERRPEFDMASRDLLRHINYIEGTIEIEEKIYPLNDRNFPTIDPSDPNRLTEEEAELMRKLRTSFLNSEKLGKHIRCLYAHGSLYLAMNSNLLYHASIPLAEDGSFLKVKLQGETYSGKALMDEIDRLAREAYFGRQRTEAHSFAVDYMWYLWCGAHSPLFGKDKMTTFERYFIDDKESHKEKKGPYFQLINHEETCNRIFKEFGLPPASSHIINGHIPVKTLKGESPIKAGGKLLVIDGGFSKAYQPETGIAGYTLIFNSYGLQLVQHEPFESTQKAIEEGQDIKSTRFVVESNIERIKVRDTNIGRELMRQTNELHKLLYAYRSGLIKERK